MNMPTIPSNDPAQDRPPTMILLVSHYREILARADFWKRVALFCFLGGMAAGAVFSVIAYVVAR